MTGNSGSTKTIGAEVKNEIKDTTYWAVNLPYREILIWPSYCALCGNPHPDAETTVETQFKKGDYGVAKVDTHLTFSGIKICRGCKKKVTIKNIAAGLTASIWFVTSLVAFGGIMAILFMLAPNTSKFGLSMGSCISGLVIGIAVAVLFHLKVVSRVGGIHPVTLGVRTEKMNELGLGSVKPLLLKMSFRNKRYAYDFAKANGAMLNIVCNKCKTYLLKDPEKNLQYCINCSYK